MTTKRALVAVPLALLVALVVAVLVVASQDHGIMSSSKASNDAGGATSAEDSSLDAAASNGARAGAVRNTSVGPMSRAVISTGQVTLHSKEMTKARAEVLRLVASWGGTVADERSSSDSKGRLADTTMTLRVPSAHFDEAMSALADLGQVEQESRKSEDVTTKVIDTDARVRAAERSIRSIENLLSRATRMGDIIAIENDLARRQADLDSLRSQQAWLRDQTSLSTINVYLSRSMPPAPRSDAHGFFAGLENGWHALGIVTVAVLTTVGAVLPFAVLLAILGLPVWLVVRRRLRLSDATPPARSA
jgi:hypothetical protein